jgi:hypothetical protein
MAKKKIHSQKMEEEHYGVQHLCPKIGWKEKQRIWVCSYFPMDDHGTVLLAQKKDLPWKLTLIYVCCHEGSRIHASPP